MRLFLQLNLVDWKESSYQKPLLAFASSLADDIIGTDLDSQSESFIADMVVRLINEAQHVFVVVVAHNADIALGSTLKIFNRLLADHHKVHTAVLLGKHATTEKMLQPFQEKFYNQNDDEGIRDLIKQFAVSV